MDREYISEAGGEEVRHFLGGIMGKQSAPWEKVTGTDLKAP